VAHTKSGLAATREALGARWTTSERYGEPDTVLRRLRPLGRSAAELADRVLLVPGRIRRASLALGTVRYSPAGTGPEASVTADAD
jgi:hypothetical protein